MKQLAINVTENTKKEIDFFVLFSGSFAASFLSGDGNRNLLMPLGLGEGNRVRHRELYCSWR